MANSTEADVLMNISDTKRKAQRGVTLIELMVVIAVISLIAALVAPNVFQNIGTAKDAAAPFLSQATSDLPAPIR